MNQPCARFDSLFAACRRVLPVLAALVLSTPAAARVEVGSAAAEAEVTVGCMFPMTGRAAIYGRDSIAGIRLALADLAAQDASTPRLRVLVEDTRSKASYAVRIAEDFIARDQARFLCGMVSSGVAHAVSQVALERKVILVGTDHASSRLTIEAFHKYYFRVSNDSYISMAAGAHYLAELQQRTGWKRLAFIGPDYDYGHVSWNDLKSNFERLGVRFELVGTFWPKLYEPDYSAYIDALMQAAPDIVVTALWGGDFIAFLKQAATTDFFRKTRLANFDTGANYEVMVALGERPPPGLIVSARHHNNWPDTERNRRFVEAFHRAEGRYPTYAAQGAYSGILAIAAAIRKAGARADSDALVAAMEGLRLELPEDPEGFTSWIDPDTHQIVQMQAVGEVVPDASFPPARVMAGKWRVYRAEDLMPAPALVRERRAQARGTAASLP
ncbi:ABC transporter substrate-binding protein [Thauera aromatica]|uniref:ABC transporter substrate-binding protein n=1 Tax=Thauera aromatica TaxID=59405 RepID=UPI001B85D536|nr:ABC transporter substrate-binding protein [Thauera aromatica]